MSIVQPETSNNTMLKEIINTLDPSALLALVSKDGLMLEHVKPENKTKELLIAAATNNSDAMRFFDEFSNNEEFMLEFIPIWKKITNDSNALLNYVGKSLRKNKKFILACVRSNGSHIKYAEYVDEEIALVAAESYGSTLSCVENDLCTYKLCAISCKYSYDAIFWTPRALLTNKEFIKELIDHDNEVISYLKHFSLEIFTVEDDMEYISIILDHNSHLAQYFPKFLASRELVLDLVSNGRVKILKLCDNIIKNDMEIILAGININPYETFRYMSPNLKNNKEVLQVCFARAHKYGRCGIMSKVEIIDSLLENMGEEIKTDVEFMLKLLVEKIINTTQFNKFMTVKAH